MALRIATRTAGDGHEKSEAHAVLRVGLWAENEEYENDQATLVSRRELADESLDMSEGAPPPSSSVVSVV